MNSFACQTVMCIENSGIFKEGRLYYCFAETGDAFWLHAPWLLETLGVDQIKVPIATKDKFVLKN